MNRRHAVCALIIVAVQLFLAAPARAEKHPSRTDSTTCVVLSVRGPKGLAHIGALDAITRANIHVDFVFGNSMGSVIGSIYASDPTADMSSRYRASYDSYFANSQQDANRRGVAGAIIGAVLTGGVSLLGVAGGVAAGYGTFERYDADRFQRTLDQFFNERSITDLQIPFATSYYEVVNASPVLRVCHSRNIAEAVRRSANNPLIFKTTDLRFIDPGVDRVSATPIQDAYKLFHPDRIIAINVTGQPAFYDHALPCDILEVMINANVADTGLISGRGDIFEALYSNSYATTVDALVRGGYATYDTLPRVSERRSVVSAEFQRYGGALTVCFDGVPVFCETFSRYGGNVQRSVQYRGHSIDVDATVDSYQSSARCTVMVDNQDAGQWTW